MSLVVMVVEGRRRGRGRGFGEEIRLGRVDRRGLSASGWCRVSVDVGRCKMDRIFLVLIVTELEDDGRVLGFGGRVQEGVLLELSISPSSAESKQRQTFGLETTLDVSHLSDYVERTESVEEDEDDVAHRLVRVVGVQVGRSGAVNPGAEDREETEKVRDEERGCVERRLGRSECKG